MLRKGVTVEAIKADYPALTIDDIRFAEIYAVVKRPPGRPTKPITFRSAADHRVIRDLPP
jgi:hypothetical protein